MARWLRVPGEFVHLLGTQEGATVRSPCRAGQRGWTFASAEVVARRIVETEDPPPADLACPACLLLWAEAQVIDEELDEALARGYRPFEPASPPAPGV